MRWIFKPYDSWLSHWALPTDFIEIPANYVLAFLIMKKGIRKKMNISIAVIIVIIIIIYIIKIRG